VHVERADGVPGAVAELGDIGRHGGRQQPRAQTRNRLIRDRPRHLPLGHLGRAFHRSVRPRRGAHGARRFASGRGRTRVGKPGGAEVRESTGEGRGSRDQRGRCGVGGRRQQPEILLQPEHGGEADTSPGVGGESEMRTLQ